MTDPLQKKSECIRYYRITAVKYYSIHGIGMMNVLLVRNSKNNLHVSLLLMSLKQFSLW